MLGLLQLMFTLARSGIVNYHLLEAVFQRLGSKVPGLNGTTKPLKVWAGAMSQSVRIAMAHVRKLSQQPRRFDQRTRGLSQEEKQTLKDLVAMHKKPEDAFVDSFEPEDAHTTNRVLRKVDTDELSFNSFCADLGEWPSKRKKRKTMASKGGTGDQVDLQATLNATALIQALSADPVSPALKQGIRKKPASPVFKKPSRAEEEDKGSTEEEEEEEEEAEEDEREEEEEEQEEKEEDEEEEEEEEDEEADGGRGCTGGDKRRGWRGKGGH
jgi:hypothetical protein